MAAPNDFSAYYRTISNAALLDILNHQQNYQPEAVEAAKNELMSRRLTEADISEAKESLAADQLQEQQRKDKAKEAGVKLKNAGVALVDLVNPIQQEKPTTGKIILLISLVYGGIFIYQLISDFHLVIGSIKGLPRFPGESLLYLGPFILLSIAVFNFYKRKATGWVLLGIYVTFTLVGELGLLMKAFTWKPSGLELLDRLYARPSATTAIIVLSFYIGTLYMLCKPGIRDIFKISGQKATRAILLTSLFTFFLLFIFQ